MCGRAQRLPTEEVELGKRERESAILMPRVIPQPSINKLLNVEALWTFSKDILFNVMS